MKITLNKTDRSNEYTHAKGIYVIYVKSIYRLLKFSVQNGNMIHIHLYNINITILIKII